MEGHLRWLIEQYGFARTVIEHEGKFADDWMAEIEGYADEAEAEATVMRQALTHLHGALYCRVNWPDSHEHDDQELLREAAKTLGTGIGKQGMAEMAVMRQVLERLLLQVDSMDLWDKGTIWHFREGKKVTLKRTEIEAALATAVGKQAAEEE